MVVPVPQTFVAQNGILQKIEWLLRGQEYNIDTQDPDGCFWTTYGKKYHLFGDCQALTNTSEENLHHTSLQEAWENNRGELCSFCAKRATANEQGGTNAVTPANP